MTCDKGPRQRYQERAGLDGKEAKSGEKPRKPPTPLDSKGLAGSTELLNDKNQKENLRRSPKGIAPIANIKFNVFQLSQRFMVRTTRWC